MDRTITEQVEDSVPGTGVQESVIKKLGPINVLGLGRPPFGLGSEALG